MTQCKVLKLLAASILWTGTFFVVMSMIELATIARSWKLR